MANTESKELVRVMGQLSALDGERVDALEQVVQREFILDVMALALCEQLRRETHALERASR